jgi:hypothetical protein
MKISEAAKQWEECFSPENSDASGGCLFKNCPLIKKIKIETGDKSDETGAITWHVEGCTLFALLEKWFKKQKPGTLYPEGI